MVDSNQPSRRNILKTGAAAAGIVSGGALTTSTVLGQEEGDQSDSDISGRVSRSNKKEVHNLVSTLYGESVADDLVRIWQRYQSAVADGRINESLALDRIEQHVREELSAVLADDIREFDNHDPRSGLQSQREYELAHGELHPERDDVQKIDFTATSDDRREISLYEGNEDENGYVGYRDSSAYPNQNKLIAVCEVPGFGSVSAWAELEATTWMENGGTWDVVWEFYEKGLNLGGTCEYDIWIQEEGKSYKDFVTVRNPNAGVDGTKERARQYNFDDDTVYNIGVRLFTAASGVAKVLVDWQTISQGYPSTRGLHDISAYIVGNSID